MDRRGRALHLTLGLLLLGCLVPAWGLAFSVVSPSEQSVVQPGQSIPVEVELGAELGVRRVQYYWYAENDEPLGPQQAIPSLVGTASSTPPFGGQLRVPDEAIGVMRLLAVAEVAGGRLQTREEFDEVLVRVETPVEIVAIEFETDKPWTLRAIGEVVEIPVVAQFADGVVRRIRGSSAGSTYTSSDEQVVRVRPDGLLRVVGNGRAAVTVQNRGKAGVLEIVVNADGAPNEWPTADAGGELHVRSGETVVLSGLMSMDLDGDPLRYEWSQVRGNKVSVLDLNTPKAKFVAPKVSERRLLRFQLRVTDMAGPDTVKGATSLPAFVDVWVEP